MPRRRNRSIGGAVQIIGRPSVRVNPSFKDYSNHYDVLPFITGEMTAEEITKAFNKFKTPTVQRRLELLYDEGLVDRRCLAGHKVVYWRVHGIQTSKV